MDNEGGLNKEVASLKTIKMVDSKYHIKNKSLGKGSFAETYLAVDINNGQLLACKMISKKNLIEKINLSKNKTGTKEYFITALKNQVNTWKSISHDNIVMFKDFSETPNNIYFFLEFCEKGNLQAQLCKRGFLKQSEAIPILHQLAKGVQYLYDHGIFHRDIKTENILINEAGQTKISDFGFAKMITDEELKNNPTEGTSVGTPIYMSPQVLLGEPYTMKCDVWSLGIVFYKILYNLYPWQKTDNLHKLIHNMQGEIIFPPNIPVDDWLKDTIKGMLTVDEENRICIKKVVEVLSKATESAMDIE